MADAVGHVLVEQAAGRDRHDLHPPADAEDRQVGLGRRPGDGELGRVPVGPRGLHRGVALVGVELGRHVDPTGEDDAVEALDDLERRAVVGVAGAAG